jgi:hypothetical protein
MGEKLLERILGIGGSVRADGMMMVMVAGGGRLEILLDGGVVLLGSGEITGLEIRCQLIEGGGEAVGGRRGGDIAGLKGGEV